MQTTAPKPVSDLRLIGMFSLILVGLVVLLNIVTHFFEFENAAMGLLIVFVAGMAVGNNWAASEKARPSSGRAWKIAVYCALVATVVSAIVFVLVLGSR